MDAPIAIAVGAGVLLVTVVAAVLLARSRGGERADDDLMFRPEMPPPTGTPLPPPIGTPLRDVDPPAPGLPPQDYPDEAFAPPPREPDAAPAAPPPVERRPPPPPSRYPLDAPTVIRHRGAEPVDPVNPVNPPTKPRTSSED